MDAEAVNFPNTEWSLVLVAGSDRAAAGPALENLCRKYWPPLFSFARRNGLDREAAQDAVQGFILTLIERSSLSGLGPEGSRFRSWLLAGFTNHMASLHRLHTAAKRGGRGARWTTTTVTFRPVQISAPQKPTTKAGPAW